VHRNKRGETGITNTRGLIPTIGVVVPALTAGGGVPAVADFLCGQIERIEGYRLKVFSLATSRTDDCSLRLSSPRTWLSHPRCATGIWGGREFTHFGTSGAEFEFRRVASTSLLRRAMQQCDLIQVVSGSPAPALAVTGLGKPVVLQVATRAIVERRKILRAGSVVLRTWRRFMTRLIDRCDDRALKRVDAVMVENNWMLEHARAVVDEGTTSVQNAPPGVDCSLFAPSATRASRLRDEPYFLFVGRLSDPRKNVELLCKAYVMVCARQAKPPRLLLAGHGDLPDGARAILKASRVQERVRIVEAPSPEFLRALYRGATCLAVPSDEEGFGMVVLEAMASGVPVVATRCGGPEEIITDGSDGFLVPLDNAQALASRLCALCSHALNLRLGGSARDTALSRFSVEVAFRPFLQTYRRLLQ
jgi:D-inositol-3-phosphate glycosyltransferase